MCVIIYKPEDKIVSEETFEEGMRVNSNGWGFMWSENDTLWYCKGVSDYDTFIASWKEHGMDSKRAAIHFRITTHGGTNYHNTHPHVVNDKLMLMHNGMLKGYDCPNDWYSDTSLFADAIATTLKHNPSILNDELFTNMLSDHVVGSKLLFMDNLGNVKIIHEDKGNWTDGVWFSNNSCTLPNRKHYGGAIGYDNGWASGKTWCAKAGKFLWPFEMDDSDNTLSDHERKEWALLLANEKIKENYDALSATLKHDVKEIRKSLSTIKDKKTRRAMFKLLREEESRVPIEDTTTEDTTLENYYGIIEEHNINDTVSDDPNVVNLLLQKEMSKESNIIDLTKASRDKAIKTLKETIKQKEGDTDGTKSTGVTTT